MAGRIIPVFTYPFRDRVKASTVPGLPSATPQKEEGLATKYLKAGWPLPIFKAI